MFPKEAIGEMFLRNCGLTIERIVILLHTRGLIRIINLVLSIQEMLIAITFILFFTEYRRSESLQDYNHFLIALSFKDQEEVSTDRLAMRSLHY